MGDVSFEIFSFIIIYFHFKYMWKVCLFWCIYTFLEKDFIYYKDLKI